MVDSFWSGKRLRGTGTLGQPVLGHWHTWAIIHMRGMRGNCATWATVLLGGIPHFRACGARVAIVKYVILEFRRASVAGQLCGWGLGAGDSAPSVRIKNNQKK